MPSPLLVPISGSQPRASKRVSSTSLTMAPATGGTLISMCTGGKVEVGVGEMEGVRLGVGEGVLVGVSEGDGVSEAVGVTVWGGVSLGVGEGVVEGVLEGVAEGKRISGGRPDTRDTRNCSRMPVRSACKVSEGAMLERIGMMIGCS